MMPSVVPLFEDPIPSTKTTRSLSSYAHLAWHYIEQRYTRTMGHAEQSQIEIHTRPKFIAFYDLSAIDEMDVSAALIDCLGNEGLKPREHARTFSYGD